MVNYYKLLDVNQNAKKEEIEAAIKEKKRLWTQRQNAPRREQQQQAINNLSMIPDIEETLLNEQKRKEYDKELQNAPKEETQIDTKKIEVDDLINEGWNLIFKNDIANALMVATEATKIQGDNPDAWALLGYARAKWGDIDDAIYEYRRAIKLRPNDASFYYELGGIYEDQKQWQNAMEYYEKAAQIDPKKTIYRATMGSIFIKVGMPEEGLELLEQCVKEEPDNESYKYLLAIAYNDSAISCWTESPFVYTQIGRAITTEEQAKKSQTLLQKAADLKVDDKELNELIKTNMKATEWALSKHWDWNFNRTHGGFASALIYPIVVVLISLGLMASGSPIGFAIGIAIIAFYVWIKYVPGWKINARDIDDEKELERFRK